MTDITEANNEVNETYDYLKDAVMSMVSEVTKPIDDIVDELSKGVNLLSNTELWDYQMRLSVEAYKLGTIKEQGSLKELCAEALFEEGRAKSFSNNEGPVESKKQHAIIDTSDKKAVSMLYATAASLLKTKCDEAHRLVNTIQNIQISRAAEAKINGSPRNESDRMILNEDFK